MGNEKMIKKAVEIYTTREIKSYDRFLDRNPNSISGNQLRTDALRIWNNVSGRKNLQIFKNVTAATIAILLFGGTLLLSSNPISAAFLTFYFNLNSEYIEFVYNSEVEKEFVSYFYPLVPDEIGNDVRITSEQISGTSRDAVYIDADGYGFNYSAVFIDNSLKDIMFGDYEFIYETIGDKDCMIAYEETYIYIFWEENDIRYEISSDTYDLEKLEEIVNSMRQGKHKELPDEIDINLPNGYELSNAVYSYDTAEYVYTKMVKDEIKTLTVEVIIKPEAYKNDLDDSYAIKWSYGKQEYLLFDEGDNITEAYWEGDKMAYIISADSESVSVIKNILKKINIIW